MTTLTHRASHEVDNPASGEMGLYRIAGAAALFSLIVALADIIITFFPEGVAPDPGMGSVIDWFALYQRNVFMGLRGLGLFNIVNMICTTLVMFALYRVHRQSRPVFLAIVVMMYFGAAVLYISNNAAVPMAVLSSKYAAATSEMQRNAFISAGEALLARGEDFTPGSFLGFFLSEAALIAISIEMVRSRIFGRAVGIIGIVGFSLLTLFTIWATFIPVFYDIAMLPAMVGGILSLVWYFRVSLQFFRFAQSDLHQPRSIHRQIQGA